VETSEHAARELCWLTWFLRDEDSWSAGKGREGEPHTFGGRRPMRGIIVLVPIYRQSRHDAN